jgi:hypothetical protein
MTANSAAIAVAQRIQSRRDRLAIVQDYGIRTTTQIANWTAFEDQVVAVVRSGCGTAALVAHGAKRQLDFQFDFHGRTSITPTRIGWSTTLKTACILRKANQCVDAVRAGTGGHRIRAGDFARCQQHASFDFFVERRSSPPQSCCSARVCLWPIASIRTHTLNGRYRRHSGHCPALGTKWLGRE